MVEGTAEERGVTEAAVLSARELAMHAVLTNEVWAEHFSRDLWKEIDELVVRPRSGVEVNMLAGRRVEETVRELLILGRAETADRLVSKTASYLYAAQPFAWMHKLRLGNEFVLYVHKETIDEITRARDEEVPFPMDELCRYREAVPDVSDALAMAIDVKKNGEEVGLSVVWAKPMADAIVDISVTSGPCDGMTTRYHLLKVPEALTVEAPADEG